MPAQDSIKAATEIRALIEDFTHAVRRKDLEKIMSWYAPDVTAFDIMPPLQGRGTATHRKNWEMWFQATEGPIGYEVRDLNIVAADDVAFCHMLTRATSTMKQDGKVMDMRLRGTIGLRKIDGKWLVTHEHVSVPIEMESGKGVFDLEA
jgi:uncharacterized protein (TIGR02246 family)